MVRLARNEPTWWGGRPHSLCGVADEEVGAPGVALFAVIRDGIRGQGRLCR